MKRKIPIKKKPRVNVCVSLLQQNYEYLLGYIANIEETQGLKITVSRALNAALHQLKHGTPDTFDEAQYRARRRPLTDLVKRPDPDPDPACPRDQKELEERPVSCALNSMKELQNK